MTAKDNIEEKLQDLASAISSDEKLVNNIMRQIDKEQAFGPMQAKTQNIWRIIMKSPISKIAAAAVIIIAVTLGIFNLDFNTRVYGITDVPELFKNAGTMHIKGWFYPPQEEQGTESPVKLEIEYWFDMEKGCYNLKKPGSINSQTGEPRYYLTISDGQYLMNSAYRISREYQTQKKIISFTKLSPFQARFEAYKTSYSFFTQMFGNIDQTEGSIKVGQEENDGIVYDIWQSEFYLINGCGQRIRTWLSSESGDIGRILFWQTLQANQDETDLRLIFDLYTIELGVIPPEGIFDTTVPDGYEPTNTKETASVSALGVDINYRFRAHDLLLHIGFTLPDSSVIIGWSCQSKVDSSGVDIDLFDKLISGGELPLLAARIETLQAITPAPVIDYQGYHLAYTRKDGNFYEWGLYIPNNAKPLRSSLLGYETNVKFEVDQNDHSSLSTWPNSLTEDLLIETSEDFNKWVLGAMAELSDDGRAPADVTYENVLRLAQQIRESAAK